MKPVFKTGLIGAIIISFIFSSLPFVAPAQAQSRKKDVVEKIKQSFEGKSGKDIIKEIRNPRFRPAGYGKENASEEELSALIKKYEQAQDPSARKESSTKKPTSAIEANALTPLSKINPSTQGKKAAWMLNPKVFKNLSTVGKKAALYLNGMLEPSTSTKTTSNFSSTIDPKLDMLGRNVRVNDPSTDTVLRTQSETSIAVRGNNVITSFNDISIDRNTCGYSFSTDGGNTFRQTSIPEPLDQINLGDGVVAYGPNGELYYALLALKGNNFTSIVGVTKSTDNGATFQGLGDASNMLNNDDNFHDKEWIAVDNSSTATRGNVYVSWTVFGVRDTFIAVSASSDGGKTFGAPINVSGIDNFVVQGSMPIVGPNGEVYVVFSGVDRNFISGLILVKSIDGGKTFSAPKAIVGSNNFPFFGVTGGDGVRCNGFPSLAVDKDGRVHIVYADLSAGATRDRSDIFYIRSTDGGSTFSFPSKVNDDATDTTQINPSVAVAGDGTVGIRWWDRRNDSTNDSLTDVYMAFSRDNGSSFGKNFRITDNNWVFSPTEGGDYHGDYDGLVADDKNFYLSWSDERSGDADVYFTQVPSSRDLNAGDFNLSTLKTFDNVLAGGKADYNLVTSAINGSSDRLSLSASPQIAGINYNFNKTGLNAGETATLSVSTTSAAQAGTYLITVTATSNSSVRRTNLRLTVYGADRKASLPVNVSNTRGNTFTNAGIQIDSKNVLHMVYEDDTQDAANGGVDIFYRQSLDGGKTFSEPKKLSQPDSLFNNSPTLALDKSGNIYALWVGDIQVFLSKSTDQGKTFSNPLGITPRSDFANIASIAIDKNNNVMVAYNAFRRVGQTFQPTLLVTRSENAGSSFAEPVMLFQATNTTDLLTSAPYLAFNSKGAVFIVYNVATFGTTSVKVEANMIMSKNGKKFKKSIVVSDPALQSFQTHVAVDQSDAIYIAFYDVTRSSSGTRRDIKVVKSTNNGKTFSPRLNVSNSGRATAPYIAIDSQGNPTLAWQETTGVIGRDIFFASSNNKGQSFGSRANLSSNSGSSLLPSAVFDSKDTLFVNWTDDSGANPEIFVSGIPKN